MTRTEKAVIGLAIGTGLVVVGRAIVGDSARTLGLSPVELTIVLALATLAATSIARSQ